MKSLLQFAGAALVAALLAPVASAATAEGPTALEEIVVTARKREESLQEVPTSVSVLTGKELAERGLPTVDALGQIVPNMHFEAANGTSGVRSPQVFIRGMGQADFIIVEDPAVGIYIDGVFTGRMLGNTFDLIDIERVEVLRGPQGTLFGRNTIGGAVNIISRKPEDELGANVRIGAGEEGHREQRLTVNVPFAEGWGSRVTLFNRERDGYIKALQYQDYDLGNEDLWGARAQISGSVGERLTIDVSADYSEDTSAPSGAVTVAGIGVFDGVQKAGPGQPGVFGNFWNTFWSGNAASCTTASGQATNPQCYGPVWNGGRYSSNVVFTDLDGNKIKANQDLEVWGTNLTLSLDVGGAVVKSITAYREFDAYTYNDLDFSPHIVFANTHPEYSQDQFSQELQVTGDLLDQRLHYVAGVYYYEEQGVEYIYNQVSHTPANTVGPPSFFFQNIWRDIDNDSTAVFAQVTYDLLDTVHLTVGDRYTDSDKNFELTTERPTSSSFQFGGLSQTEHTPMASVSWDFLENNMVYFTYSEGFRDGGYPARFTGVVPNPLPNYEPEFVTNYEVGYKGTLFDGRVRLNAAAFQMDYDDMQITATSSVGGQTSKANLGQATVRGLDLELMTLLFDNLTVGVNLGILDDEIDSFRGTLVSSGITITKSNDLPFTPDWTLSLTAAYDIPLPNGAAIALRSDYAIKDDYYTAIENIEETLEDNYRVLNASIRYISADELWSVGIMGRNVTDEDFFQSRTIFDSFQLGFGQPIRPRTVSAFFEYNF